MVTASDGRPKPVTKRPFTAPSTAPSSTTRTQINSRDSPLESQSCPISVLHSPTMLATERSISPVITIRVIGSAMSASGIRSSSRNCALRPVAKFSTVRLATSTATTRAATMTASQETNTPRRLARRPAPGSASAVVGAAYRLSCAMRASPSEPGRHPQGQEPVQPDGGEDECADHGLLPERVDAQDGE